MMPLQWCSGVLSVLLSVGCLATPAGAFYCGRRLISSGDPQYKVQRLCGDPADRQWRVTYRPHSVPDPRSGASVTIVEPVVIEVWLYDFGPQRFVEEVAFEDGRVVSVQPLGYGYEYRAE